MYSTVAQDSYENLQTTDKAVQFIKDNMDYDMGTVDHVMVMSRFPEREY